MSPSPLPVLYEPRSSRSQMIWAIKPPLSLLRVSGKWEQLIYSPQSASLMVPKSGKQVNDRNEGCTMTPRLSLEQLEGQLSTPRQIAMKRMQYLGEKEGGEISGGLPMQLVSLLEEAYESWSSFINNTTAKLTNAPLPPQTICNSVEVKNLQRTISMLSNITQIDPILGEEICRAGSHSICSRLIERINKFTNTIGEDRISVEDSDALIELQDLVFEIYSPSASARSLAFTNDELRKRLPLIYNLTPVSNDDDEMQTGAEDNTTIFINQVTKRQSAQADVGFVMWPSAIILSRWLISNPHILQGKYILELGAGCGLVGITAALITQTKYHKSKQDVIITDVNELVLENITQNIKLNDVESIASVAKLDFYSQTGQNSGKWIAGEMNGIAEGERDAVDVILAADIICQPEDAVAASKTIVDALGPGGVALIVCANAEHRFGVEIFASECESRGLEVSATNVAEMYNGNLLSRDMESATGYIEGMELTFFRVMKQ